MVAMGLAIAALIVIGVFEAGESVRQITEVTGKLQLTPAGARASAIGLAASAAVYLALGWSLARDRDAVRAGALVGLAAGLLGGGLRSILILVVVEDAVRRYAAVPEWFVPAALAVFVLLSVAVSVGGGAALTFFGVRLEHAIRSGRSRPLA